MLSNIGGLTGDLIHPSDNAMIEMGRNLSGRLKNLLKDQGPARRPTTESNATSG